LRTGQIEREREGVSTAFDVGRVPSRGAEFVKQNVVRVLHLTPGQGTRPTAIAPVPSVAAIARKPRQCHGLFPGGELP